MRNFCENLLRAWCRRMHGAPMHPIMGVYRCRKCQRTYLVDWEARIKPVPISPKGKVKPAEVL